MARIRTENKRDAIEVSLPGTADYNFMRPVIYDAPADLPDSAYKIAFGGNTEDVQRHDGAWVARVSG